VIPVVVEMWSNLGLVDGSLFALGIYPKMLREEANSGFGFSLPEVDARIAI
jgi:hypothetical protein